VAQLPSASSGSAGGLMIYCAGCMLAVGDQLPGVAAAATP